MKLWYRSLDTSCPPPPYPLSRLLTLSFSFTVLLLVVLLPANMNWLPTFGVSHELPKSEFIHLLAAYPTVDLKSLRECLFEEASKANLVPSELRGLPLVGRRDTAIRPASQVLSEDVWTLVTCITNCAALPRTLIKNGKRSRKFLNDAPRSLLAPNRPDITVSSSDGTPTSQVSTLNQDSHLDQSHIQPPPSTSEFSNSLISREINSLKDELRSLRTDVASLNRRPPAVFPSELQRQFGQELKVIKEEISHLHDSLHKAKNPRGTTPPPPLPTDTGPTTVRDRNLMVSTWNCRGLQNATPYLHRLIDQGSDIIAINEHWLWPYLPSQHPPGL